MHQLPPSRICSNEHLLLIGAVIIIITSVCFSYTQPQMKQIYREIRIKNDRYGMCLA